MSRVFTPTPGQRKEEKIRKERKIKERAIRETRKMEDNCHKKIRFGALLSINPPKKHQKTKSFMVYLDKPLPWEVIVTRVTKALEDLV